MKRYYITSRKADGYYHVDDRELSLTIARCVYREQAVLVAEALNRPVFNVDGTLTGRIPAAGTPHD